MRHMRENELRFAIRAKMGSCGMEQKDLAKFLKTTHPLISNWLLGKISPSRRSMKKLVAFLAMPAETVRTFKHTLMKGKS